MNGLLHSGGDTNKRHLALNSDSNARPGFWISGLVCA